MKHIRMARWCMIVVSLAVLSGALSAQDTRRLILGLGGMYVPEHPGSERHEWGVCPFINAEWGNERFRLYAAGTEAGVRALGIGLERLSLFGGASMGESRDGVSNPVRAFAGLSYGTESLSLSTRLVYAPYWEGGDFGGHGILPELYLSAQTVRLPIVLAGTLSVMAMDGAWAEGFFLADAGLLNASVDGNALLYVRRNAGLFLGGTVTRYIGEAERSDVTESAWGTSIRLGAFIMVWGGQ